MAMIELFENAVQFASQPLGYAHPKDLSHLVGGQPEQAHLAGAFENLVDGEIPFEDEVPAVFDLIY
jgi:hypothetical protein